jgi:hypothetical protein
MEQITAIIAELDDLAAKAREAFGALSGEQINWKASSDSWSVGQCFDHLIKINSAYFAELDGIIAGERKQTLWESYSPFSGFLGNMLHKSLSQQAGRKFKAPKIAEPAASSVSPAIIDEFITHQAQLTGKIRRTETLDTRKIVLTSPFMKAITYSLFDAYRIIATHEKRHFQQAETVLQATGFPR